MHSSLVTDRPLFYLSLLVVVLSTQLFLAGFLAELIVTNSHKSNEYIISEKIGLENNNK